MARFVFAAAAIAALAAPAAHAQTWTAVILHGGGATQSRANGVHSGRQAGYAYVLNANGPGLSAYHAGFWRGSSGTWTDLDPGLGTESYAFAEDGLQQGGYVNVFGNNHASIWTGTPVWLDLNPIVGGSPALASHILGMGSGQQVGTTFVGAAYHACMWSGSAASWVDLNPAGAASSIAYGCGSAQQVGSAVLGGVTRAGRWTGSAASWILLHPAGSTYSEALAAAGGQQVGYAEIGGIYRASLWTGTAASRVDLTPPGTLGSNGSQATATDGIQQAGWTFGSAGLHAGIWSGTSASWEDLHVYLPASFPYSQATGIWRSGSKVYVTGYADTGGSGDIGVLWVKGDPCVAAGMTGDGHSTTADVAVFINLWAASLENGSLEGDFDNNGVVNPADVAAYINAWLQSLTLGC